MSTKRSLSFIFAAPFFLWLSPVFAQDTPPAPELQAVISTEVSVQVGQSLTLSAEESTFLNSDEPVEYSWAFGDGSTSNKSVVTHEFSEPGIVDVTLSIRQQDLESVATKRVFVYTRALNIFTTESSGTAQLASVKNFALEHNIYLNLIEIYDNASDLEATTNLTQAMTRSSTELGRSDTIVIWTHGGLGLNALSDFANVKDSTLEMNNKTIVYVTDGNLRSLSRIAQSVYQVLKPKNIILTRPEALFTPVESEGSEALVSTIIQRGYEYRIVNESTTQVSVLNFLSVMVNYLRNQGMSSDALLLLLMIPVIATIVTFSRQVIGMNTIGIYIPTILTVVFITLGFWLGLFLLGLVLGLTSGTRKLLTRWHLLYIPRLAITVTVVALGFLIALGLSSYFGLSLAKTSMLSLIVLILLSEDFLSIESERGLIPAILLMLETSAVALVSYVMVAKWEAFQTFILGYPEMILALLAIDVALGKYTGLRLTEILRFRSLLSHAEQAEEE